jgi:hypothetical protein
VLNGTVNAKGASSTVTFDYGLTTGYGSSAAATPSPVTGIADTAVKATLASLTPGTTYHYRVKAVSAGGTVMGTDASFTTPSNLATLSSLVLSAGTLSPAFTSGTTTYTATVPNGTSSITFTPTVSQAQATVKVNGTLATSGTASNPVNLSAGSNAIPVQVVAQDGTTTKTYTVTVTRTAVLANVSMAIPPVTPISATSVSLNGLVTANNGNTTASFDYGLTTLYGSNAASPTPVTGNTQTAVSVTLTNLTPGSTYHYRLKGVNAAGTAVTTDGTFATPSNVSSLANLVISAGTLSPAFSSGTKTYSATVASTIATLIVTPTVKQAQANVCDGERWFAGHRRSSVTWKQFDRGGGDRAGRYICDNLQPCHHAGGAGYGNHSSGEQP